MNAITRFLAGRKNRDGDAAPFEAAGTGLPPSVLIPAETENAAADRRQRALGTAEANLRDALSQKVLHGWLQNRHQTLLPLTVNFRLLPEADGRLLADLLAAVLLASSGSSGAGVDAAAAFLRQNGGPDALLRQFQAALHQPEPLFRLFERIREAELGPLAYILVVVGSDSRDVADQLFMQWVAAKLELPNTVIRSVERRYRR